MTKHDKSVRPPYGNTGVGHTTATDLNAIVDWLSITFKKILDPEDVISILGLDFELFSKTLHGFHGYAEGYSYGSIKVYYSGSDNMGVHVVLSGTACEEYASLCFSDDYSWSDFMSVIFEYDVNVSRLDIALDDHIGLLNLKTMHNKVKAGHVSSRFKTSRNYTEHRLSDGAEAGQTLYFGTRKSDVMFRFYDKRAEQLDKVVDLPDVWLRYEIELKNERALKVAKFIARGDRSLADYVAGLLGSYITFRVPRAGDTNKSRWNVSPFWTKFLGEVEKVDLTFKTAEYSLGKTLKWLEKQVFPSLSMFMQAVDHNALVYMYIQEKGNDSLNDARREQIRRLQMDDELISQIRNQMMDNMSDMDLFTYRQFENDSGYSDYKKGVKSLGSHMERLFEKEVLDKYDTLTDYYHDNPFG